jgi:ABC-type amino acid transport substrate-binding protein
MNRTNIHHEIKPIKLAWSLSQLCLLGILGFILTAKIVFASDLVTSEIPFTEQEIQFIQEHPVIIVGGEKNWPPFDFVQNGEYTCAAKDYLDLLSKATGLTFDIKTGLNWDGLLNGTERKEIDLLPMVYWEQQRTKYLNYTKPFLTVRQYLFIHEDADMITSMAGLDNKVLAIPKSYAQIALLKKQYPNIHILEVDSPLDAIDAVITKRVDGFIENTALISYLQKENGIQGLKAAFATELGAHDLHMATRKDWQILRDIIQKGLDNITQEQNANITNRWIPLKNTNNNRSSPRKIALSEQQKNYLAQKKVIKACVDPNWMPLEAIERGEIYWTRC